MDERRKQQLMEGCMRIRKEIAAWLLMALWVIFSVKIAEVLLGESPVSYTHLTLPTIA